MDAREAKERFKNADSMYREGRYGQALVLLDSLNEQYPNTKNIMYPRALCLAKVGRVDEAVVVCDELVARFGHKRAAALKAKLTPRQAVMPPSIAAIPGFDEPAVSAVPRLQAAPRPFFVSVPFLVGTAVIVVAAIAVLAYLFVPRDTFEALLKTAPTVARPETPSATERVETEGGAQGSPKKAGLPSQGTVPDAAILVDGQSYDWNGVPVFASVSKGEYGPDTYGVQTVKLAHDSVNLYVLLQLGLGIDEKFDAEYQRSGTVSSGSIGHLGIAVPGTTYRIWLPTYFVQTTDPATGTAVMYPTVDAEVARIDPSTGASQTVLEVDSANNPDSIAFAGKNLELKLPIGPLGFPTDQMASVTLDPF